LRPPAEGKIVFECNRLGRERVDLSAVSPPGDASEDSTMRAIWVLLVVGLAGLPAQSLAAPDLDLEPVLRACPAATDTVTCRAEIARLVASEALPGAALASLANRIVATATERQVADGACADTADGIRMLAREADSARLERRITGLADGLCPTAVAQPDADAGTTGRGKATRAAAVSEPILFDHGAIGIEVDSP
jgi:hypothetical protein